VHVGWFAALYYKTLPLLKLVLLFFGALLDVAVIMIKGALYALVQLHPFSWYVQIKAN